MIPGLAGNEGRVSFVWLGNPYGLDFGRAGSPAWPVSALGPVGTPRGPDGGGRVNGGGSRWIAGSGGGRGEGIVGRGGETARDLSGSGELRLAGDRCRSDAGREEMEDGPGDWRRGGPGERTRAGKPQSPWSDSLSR